MTTVSNTTHVSSWLFATISFYRLMETVSKSPFNDVANSLTVGICCGAPFNGELLLWNNDVANLEFDTVRLPYSSKEAIVAGTRDCCVGELTLKVFIYPFS